MKKLLDNNLFIGVLIALQLIFLGVGVLVAIYDGGHISAALLCMTTAFLFVLNVILAVLALVLKSTKKGYYFGLMLFWSLLFALLFYGILFAQYEYREMEDEVEKIERLMEEDKTHFKQDSIYVDSIQ